VAREIVELLGETVDWVGCIRGNLACWLDQSVCAFGQELSPSASTKNSV
jgi:hypothetical protein